MKRKIADLAVQILTVMIGVFLGVVASDWAEEKKLQNQANTFKENLRTEMFANMELLEGIIDYHRMLRDSSKYYAMNDVPIDPSYYKGSRITYLTSSAYETGIQTGVITELPLNDIQALNQIYTLQKAYNDYAAILLTGLLNKDFSYKQESMKALATFVATTMTDVVSQEAILLKEYEKAIKVVD